MEPDLQKFSVVALVGLLAFFPVFNQVRDTALETMTDTDHQGKWSDFFKDWDDIPDDEKVDYWDGRNKPAGAGSGFDDDRVDDNFKHGGGDPEPGDRDGDGVQDEDDADPDDPNVTKKQQYRWQTITLWSFSGGGQGQSPRPELISQGHDYHWVNVTYDYVQFTGNMEFELTEEDTLLWRLASNTASVAETDDGSRNFRDVGTADLTMQMDYSPYAAPQSFEVEITGAYKQAIEEDD